jgi:hypothetical protein
MRQIVPEPYGTSSHYAQMPTSQETGSIALVGHVSLGWIIAALLLVMHSSTGLQI